MYNIFIAVRYYRVFLAKLSIHFWHVTETAVVSITISIWDEVCTVLRVFSSANDTLTNWQPSCPCGYIVGWYLSPTVLVLIVRNEEVTFCHTLFYIYSNPFSAKYFYLVTHLLKIYLYFKLTCWTRVMTPNLYTGHLFKRRPTCYNSYKLLHLHVMS